MFSKKKIITAITSLSAMAMMNTAVAESVSLDACGPQADHVYFWVDASGSIMQVIDTVKSKDDAQSDLDNQKRIQVSKDFLIKSKYAVGESSALPVSVYTVAPFTNLISEENRTVEEFTQLLNEKLNTHMGVFGRSTKFGTRAIEFLHQTMKDKSSIILITDGNFLKEDQHSDLFAAELSQWLANHSSHRVTLVSAAYTEEEKQAIMDLSQKLPQVEILNLESLMTQEKEFQRFVETKLWKDCSSVPVIDIDHVLFDFDKDIITQEGKEILLKAIEVIKTRKVDERIIIRGWTDWTGSDAYNADLSLRRAKSVKRFFEQQGLDIERFEVEGKGKSFKFTNHTAEGRHQNRHAELIFIPKH